MKKSLKNKQLKDTKPNFLEKYEEWHYNKYSDEYRYRNKPPFYLNPRNYLKIGILSLLIPFLCLIVSFTLNLGISFYLFFLIFCLPGILLVVKYYRLK